VSRAVVVVIIVVTVSIIALCTRPCSRHPYLGAPERLAIAGTDQSARPRPRLANGPRPAPLSGEA